MPNPSCVLAGGVHAEEAPASARSSACYAVPETSAVQQPVMKVHSKSTAFCACVDVPVAEQNFQMDIVPVLPVLPELPVQQPECADGVPFEETDEEVVDWLRSSWMVRDMRAPESLRPWRMFSLFWRQLSWWMK